MVQALPFIHLNEWRERRVTCQQLIGDIKHKCRNIVLLRLFSGLEILVKHRSLYDKYKKNIFNRI